MPRVKKAALEKKPLNLLADFVSKASVKMKDIVENNTMAHEGQEIVTESIHQDKAPNLKSPVKRNVQTLTTKGLRKDDANGETPNKIIKVAVGRGSKQLPKKMISAVDNHEGDSASLIENKKKPESTKRKGRTPNKVIEKSKSLEDISLTAETSNTKKETNRKIAAKRKLDGNLNSIEENAVGEKHSNITKQKSKKSKVSKMVKKITTTKKTKESIDTLTSNLENDESKTEINNEKDDVPSQEKAQKPKRNNRKKQSKAIDDDKDGQITNEDPIKSPMGKSKKPKVDESTNLIENDAKNITKKTRKEKTVKKVSSSPSQVKDEVKMEKKSTINRKKKTAVEEDIPDKVGASIKEASQEKILSAKGKSNTRAGTRKRNISAVVLADEPIGKQEKEEEEMSEDSEDEDGQYEARGKKDAKIVNKVKRKPNVKSNQPLNNTTTIYNKEDFELKLTRDVYNNDGKQPLYNFKISSWNVAGLRSWVTKDGLKYVEYEEPDIFCMQETKCTTELMPPEVSHITGYHPYWLCMPGGYAGVAIYSKIMPINVEYGIGDKDFDAVGRLITAEYEKFFLINVYVPNSGRKLVNLNSRMQWEKLFQEFVQKLDKLKPVIICGDMNVSHQEIDLANPKSNTRNAGFTKEERTKMSELLALGYVDTFRHLYPDRKNAYTYWTYIGNARSRNVGWRLDYFIVSERLVKCVVDNCIRSQCLGSDHCPITLFLKL